MSGTQRGSSVALVHLSPRSRGRALVNPCRRSHLPLLAPRAPPCMCSCGQARPPVDDPTATLPSASPLPPGAGRSSRLTSPLRGTSGGDGGSQASSLGSVTGRVVEEARRELPGEGKGQFFPRAVVSSVWLGETEGRGQREAQGPGRMSQVGNT